MTPRLAFVNDEVGPGLDDALTFAGRHGVRAIEMRSVDGVNLASTPLDRVREIAARLSGAGLAVACLASPLLKWLPAGRTGSGGEADRHGFVRDDRHDDTLLDHVFAVADILGAPLVRVFAHLRYQGFEPEHLATDYARLLDRAERHDKRLVLENEPPSNAGTVDELLSILDRWHGPRLGALLDIANVYEAGGTLDPARIRRLAPHVRHVHCKDFESTTGRRVAVGRGSVPYDEILPPLLAALEHPVTLSVETHVADAPVAATAESLAALRRLSS